MYDGDASAGLHWRLPSLRVGHYRNRWDLARGFQPSASGCSAYHNLALLILTQVLGLLDIVQVYFLQHLLLLLNLELSELERCEGEIAIVILCSCGEHLD